MTTSNLGGNARNHEYTRGLPQVAKPWRKDTGLRMPGDPEAERDRSNILSRHDPSQQHEALLSSIEAVAASSTPSMPDCSTDCITSVGWLKTVTNGHCFPPAEIDRVANTGLGKPEDWSYAQRREAQQITPFLYLGPAPVAKDQNFLRNSQITMVLVIRDAQILPSTLLEARTAERMGIETAKVDFSHAKLVSKFEEAVEKINGHLHRQYAKQQAANEQRALNREPLDTSLPARILVSDLTGNDASAVVMAAYLVAMYGCKAWEATFVIHSKRFCVTAQYVQEYMVRWADIVDARKQTRVANTPTPGVFVGAASSSRKKRATDVDEELDDFERFGIHDPMANAGESNIDQGQGRRQITAPFSNRAQDEDMEMV